jgi:hypothetical protein
VPSVDPSDPIPLPRFPVPTPLSSHATRTRETLSLVDVGVAYPQIELHGDPAAVRQFGRAVEDLGFDHLLAYDHVLGAVHSDRTPQLLGPYTTTRS